MLFVADSLDDLLRKVLENLLSTEERFVATKGAFSETSAATLVLNNPRDRLSRTWQKGTLFSCLGETLWYLSGSNSLSQITYYIRDYGQFSDDQKTVYGAYGPRLTGKRHGYPNQLTNVINLLSERPTTRKAVVQLFSAQDILEEHADVPCTCSLQFLIRGGKLDAIVYMRSNDAFLGLPHDVFAFTFLQEVIARAVGVELGRYTHIVGSLHLYERDFNKARQYVDEGWQQLHPMPTMPEGRQEKYLSKLLTIEKSLRKQGKIPTSSISSLPLYWRDLALVLYAYSQKKCKRSTRPVEKRLTWPDFAIYFRRKRHRGNHDKA